MQYGALAGFRDIEQVTLKACEANGLQQAISVIPQLSGAEARQNFARAVAEAVRRSMPNCAHVHRMLTAPPRSLQLFAAMLARKRDASEIRAINLGPGDRSQASLPEPPRQSRR